MRFKMSFFSRVPKSVQSHIKYQSIILSNARKQKSKIVLSRSIQTQECLENQVVKSLDDIPSPPAQPFIGHLGLMFKHIRSQHKFHEELRKQYGNIVVLSIPGTKLVAVYGPEEGKAMYANEGKYPVIGGFEVSEFFRERRKDIYPSPGVLCSGENWYKNRSAVQQDMMRAKSAMYYIDDMETITKEALVLFEQSKNANNSLDIYPILKLWSLESVSYIFLNKRLYCFNNESTKNTQEGKQLVDAMRELGEATLRLLFLPKLWKLVPDVIPPYRKFTKANETLNRIAKANVDNALQKLDLENDNSILAKLARRNGKDAPVINTMSQDAMLAGIDTTGYTATVFLYHLASNPEKQEILYREICEIVGSNDEPITESKLNQMRYLKACLHESQRMMPATIGSSRTATEDYVLSGYKIPKGTLVINYNMVTSNCSENFRNAEEFRPERWLRSNPESKTSHPFSSIPFGHGPRSCIGRRFALVQIYCLVIKLLQRYRIEYHGEEIGIITEFLNIPDRDVRITLVNRT